MTGRDSIFGKIRAGLGVSGAEGERERAVAARLSAHLRHPIPARVAGKSPAELAALFRSFLEGQSATVVEVASASDVPSSLAGYLRGANLPARIRTGADAYLAGLPWDREPSLEVAHGRAAAGDEVGLSHASAAVAETGTMLLASGADNPVTLNFLPETHIVVVEAKDIVGPYEDAWAKIRARFGEGVMPRTVNMISGPSRTADVGGKLVTGAHGPRRMCVVVVKG